LIVGVAEMAVPGFKIGFTMDGVGMVGLWGMKRERVKSGLGKEVPVCNDGSG